MPIGSDFQPISASPMPGHNWVGEWRYRSHGRMIRIYVEDNEARIVIGSGPATDNLVLATLDERRALFERAEGPRRQRISLSFSADGRSVLLPTLRSRVLRFERSKLWFVNVGFRIAFSTSSFGKVAGLELVANSPLRGARVGVRDCP
jgi:hypothetical protein